jgi:hypothetical protein
MPFIHLSNVARGKDFVNKLAKLSHDLIYKILIFHLLVIHVDKTISERYNLYN